MCIYFDDCLHVSAVSGMFYLVHWFVPGSHCGFSWSRDEGCLHWCLWVSTAFSRLHGGYAPTLPAGTATDGMKTPLFSGCWEWLLPRGGFLTSQCAWVNGSGEALLAEVQVSGPLKP